MLEIPFAEIERWHRQSYAGPPPYHLERHGSALLICDYPGRNIARREGGAVLFSHEHPEYAEAVMRYLSGA